MATMMPSAAFGASTKKVTMNNVGSYKNVKVGGKYNINTTTSPKKKKFKYYTSNKKIVSVNSKSGKIKGLRKGTATITVRARDGSGRKDTCKVTVGTKAGSVRFTTLKHNYVMNIGTKATLKASVSPSSAANKTLKWKSSNSSVVSVSSKGVLTAKKRGKAKIYASATDGSGKYAVYTIMSGTRVSGVNITGTTDTGIAGSSITLKSTASPSSATYTSVIWKSSDPSIATVSSLDGTTGSVTGIKPGTVTITATAKDGTYKKDEYKVTFKKLDKSVTGFIAHRGLSSAAPENTIAAYQLAADKGFYGIECDVRQSGQATEGDDSTRGLYISHDENLNRMTGKDKDISDMTPENLNGIIITGGNNVEKYDTQHLLTFKDYLDFMKDHTDVVPVIEIKNNPIAKGLVPKFVDQLIDSGLAENAKIISFYPESLTRIKTEANNPNREKKVDVQCYLLASDDGDAAIETAVDNTFKGVLLSYKIASQDVLSRAVGESLETGIWTADDYATAYEFAYERGINYLTTNEWLFE
ncbi:MAG: Ig-like domain-containing protein [Eubacteriaceae bacterium]|nr:Ig-like domain-containing protein [Eubacteriaceae bacterium]